MLKDENKKIFKSKKIIKLKQVKKRNGFDIQIKLNDEGWNWITNLIKKIKK